MVLATSKRTKDRELPLGAYRSTVVVFLSAQNPLPNQAFIGSTYSCYDTKKPQENHRTPWAQPIISHKRKKLKVSTLCFFAFMRYDWLSSRFTVLFLCSGDAFLSQIHNCGTRFDLCFFRSASLDITRKLKAQSTVCVLIFTLCFFGEFSLEF